MRAKAFFHVCAGLFLLALGIQIGASRARADFGAGVFIGWTPYGYTVVWADGSTWSYQAPGRWLQHAPLPLTYGSPAAFENHVVLTDQGYLWEMRTDGYWSGIDYVPRPGTTPAQRESMGQLKVRYR